MAILTAEAVSPEVMYELVEKGVASFGLPTLMCLLFFGVIVGILKYVVKNHNEQMKTLTEQTKAQNEQTQALRNEVKAMKDSMDTLNRGLLDILSRLATK